jgi:large subunit ribosomal protein L2
MGKRLIQQRRGRFNSRFRTPSHKNKGKIKYSNYTGKNEGIVQDIIHDPGRTAPLVIIRLKDNKKILSLATEGIKIGDIIKFSDSKSDVNIGNVMPIEKIPEGAPIYNIELMPGDGGKLVRAGGSNATVVSHDRAKTVIKLPSGKFKHWIQTVGQQLV